MKSVEELLAQMPLREPSPDLDDRVLALLDRPVRPQVRPRAASWPHLLTASACLLSGFLIGRLAAPHNSAVPVPESHRSPSAAVNPQLPVENIPEQKTRLGPESVVLLHGRPVRAFDAVTRRTIEVIDKDTGQRIPVQLPIRQTVVTPSFEI